MTADVHVLNLGAGVQSTTLYLLSMEGRIQQFDCAIFADTQDETAATYKHLEWLKTLGGAPILIRTRGCLSADLAQRKNSTGQRFASIPAFTAAIEGKSKNKGQIRRQCTKEYKIEVIERAIRREVLGLQPRRPVPRGVTIHQYIGISWDERSRAADILFKRFHKKGKPRRGWVAHFPLLDLNGEMAIGWTRDYCETVYLPARVPHIVPRSACKQCPFHSDREWIALKQQPEWDDIVQIDQRLREAGRIVNRNLDQKLYLHGSCKPIDQVVFQDENQLGFALECEGGCGL
jgi:3'-phosphoadenosine 5'-phosphosulfate sulfotransferase (PAPS reductase)/FAD synthetase